MRATVLPAGAGYELNLRVDPHSILLDPQGDRWIGRLDLLFVEIDPHGKQTFGVDDTLSMELRKPNYDRLQQEGLLYRRRIPHEPKASELRIIVRDAASGAIGSITAPFDEIPVPGNPR